MPDLGIEPRTPRSSVALAATRPTGQLYVTHAYSRSNNKCNVLLKQRCFQVSNTRETCDYPHTLHILLVFPAFITVTHIHAIGYILPTTHLRRRVVINTKFYNLRQLTSVVRWFSNYHVLFFIFFNCLVNLVVLSATATLEVLGSIPRSSKKCYWVSLRNSQ